MGDNNWDLYAVVRGCSSATAAVSDPFSSFPPPSVLKEEPLDGLKGDLFSFPDHMAPEESASDHELEELCKPFYINPQEQQLPEQQQLQSLLTPKPNYPSSTAVSLFPAISPNPHQLIQQQPRQLHKPLSHTSRSKRRKNLQKKVVFQIPVDSASSDVWAWRKYGQKPIKGSPYPRGYYRCSSSKGCQARKQVERSREDPGMLHITYTAEHNHPIPTHRNSLAGSTRQKFPPSPISSTHPPSVSSHSASGGGDHEPLISPRKSSSSPLTSPNAAAALSPTTPLMDSMEDELFQKRRGMVKAEEEEEDEFLTVGDMEMMDGQNMTFLGMEVLGGPTTSGSTKSPTIPSISSGYFEDEGNFEEHYFRCSPLAVKQ